MSYPTCQAALLALVTDSNEYFFDSRDMMTVNSPSFVNKVDPTTMGYGRGRCSFTFPRNCDVVTKIRIDSSGAYLTSAILEIGGQEIESFNIVDGKLNWVGLLNSQGISLVSLQYHEVRLNIQYVQDTFFQQSPELQIMSHVLKNSDRIPLCKEELLYSKPVELYGHKFEINHKSGMIGASRI